MFHYHWAVSCMIRKVRVEDIAIRGNGTGPEYMCPTRHFVYIFFSPVFQVSTAKNEINLFNNHVLIVAPVTFAPAGAMTPSAEFLFSSSPEPKGLLTPNLVGRIRVTCRSKVAKIMLIGNPRWPPWCRYLENLFSSPELCSGWAIVITFRPLSVRPSVNIFKQLLWTPEPILLKFHIEPP